MNEIDETLNEIQFKARMRDLYRREGSETCYILALDFLKSAQFLMEVMYEEYNRKAK